SYAELVLVLPSFRLNRNTNHRSRKFHLLQNDWLVFVANRITRGYLLHAADCNDLAGTRVFNIFAFVRVHAQQTTDALSRILNGIVGIRTSLDRASIDAHERQLTQVLVGHDLEYQSGKWRASVRRSAFYF